MRHGAQLHTPNPFFEESIRCLGVLLWFTDLQKQLYPLRCCRCVSPVSVLACVFEGGKGIAVSDGWMDGRRMDGWMDGWK